MKAMSGGSEMPPHTKDGLEAFGRANRYPPDWLKQTRQTLADDLRDRGIQLPPRRVSPWRLIAAGWFMTAGLMIIIWLVFSLMP